MKTVEGGASLIPANRYQQFRDGGDNPNAAMMPALSSLSAGELEAFAGAGL